VKPSITLSGASVGQHLRHTLEFFICLEQGYKQGFDQLRQTLARQNDRNDKEIALEVIQRIRSFVTDQTKDKTLMLEVGYDLSSNENVSVQTNYLRELTYNIEHAVHHMAIMRSESMKWRLTLNSRPTSVLQLPLSAIAKRA